MIYIDFTISISSGSKPELEKRSTGRETSLQILFARTLEPFSSVIHSKQGGRGLEETE
jgi:hypothetical protein